MDTEAQNDCLRKLANGGIPHSDIFPTPDLWPQLLDAIVARINTISLNEFPIPKLPPPPPKWSQQPNKNTSSPPPSSPLDQTSPDANKENTAPQPRPAISAPVPTPAAPPRAPSPKADAPAADGSTSATPTLPPQIQDMLDDIIASLRTFPSHPPHTIQRAAELILEPTRHYRALAPYLHALDRVVRVTSSSDRYPLPLPVVSFANGASDGAVSWASAATTTTSTSQAGLGTDEALGGALLTPIPWLSRQGSPASDQESQSRAELRTESTEVIEGPNGVGSIETVSISVNGVPSAGASRGMTQGELIRQEQRAGVAIGSHYGGSASHSTEGEGGDEDEEEHARGPEDIGASDLGPGTVLLTINRIDESSLRPSDIDLEAAVGRKRIPVREDTPEMEDAPEPEPDPPASGLISGSDGPPKRLAEEEPEGSLSAKKPRSENGDAEGDRVQQDEPMEGGVEEPSSPETSRTS